MDALNPLCERSPGVEVDLFSPSNIKLAVKAKIYSSFILPILLYGAV